MVQQTLIPIIREKTKAVLGALNLPGFTEFTGTETVAQLITPGQAVPIRAWYPDSFRFKQIPFFMAYVVDEPSFSNQSYRMWTDFVSINQFNMTQVFTSSAWESNRVVVTQGAIIDLMTTPSQ